MVDSRWILWRDMSVFKPDHHRIVLCERDTELEVLEGRKERRNTYSVDCFTGRSWGRQGSGRYQRWTTLPPAGMMASAKDHRPRPDRPIVICCRIHSYHGPRLGRLHADTGQVLYQIFSDLSNDWISIPVSYIEGWLPLP